MFRVDDIGGGEFAVTHDEGGVSRWYASPSVLQTLGADVPAQRVVEAAVKVLLRRQQPDEFPRSVDLETLAWTYEDFTERLREQLGIVATVPEQPQEAPAQTVDALEQRVAAEPGRDDSAQREAEDDRRAAAAAFDQDIEPRTDEHAASLHRGEEPPS